MRRTLDIGSGSYIRGDVNVDIDFSWSSPYMHSWKYDQFTSPRKQFCDRVRADANFRLPFRDECFDEVYMVHVLEHLLRPYDVLLEVRRVLRRGGVLKLFVPNARVNLADWRDEEHVYSWTEPTIRRLVSKVLRVLDVKLLFGDDDIYVLAQKC